MNIKTCELQEYVLLKDAVKAKTTVNNITYYGYVAASEVDEEFSKLSASDQWNLAKRAYIVDVQQNIRTAINPLATNTKTSKAKESVKIQIAERLANAGMSQEQIDTILGSI